MTLFTKEFLDKLQKEYNNDGWFQCPLEKLMCSGLSFHDAILELANHKGIEPEYFKKECQDKKPEENNQVQVGEGGVLPVNKTIDLSNLELCEKCKAAVLSEFIKAYGMSQQNGS